MPFIKRANLKHPHSVTDTRKIFVGRMNELQFFIENILDPEEPTHNIVSIFGQGGVGKSTLLARVIEELYDSKYKEYCLSALVDERQTTPVSIMERFADQLHLGGDFGKALKHYKELVRKLQTEQETLQTTILHRAPDFAGAAIEGVPIVGPILREGVKVTAGHLIDRYQAGQLHKDTEHLHDPLHDLTKTFIAELNRVADTQVVLSTRWLKRERRVLLCFDTFEQMAPEAVPWLLDYFLDAHISSNVVLVIAGRDRIDHSTADGPKRWLMYYDSNTIYSLSLNGFTEDETRTYLAARNITDPDRISTIWRLSRGLPLYLGLLTSNLQGEVDPTKDVVDNFLRWIPEREHIKRRLALDAALLSKPFNQDDLEAFTYLPEQERLDLYYWLTGLSFVYPQAGRFRYHELAQDLFSRHPYQRSKKEYYSTRRNLATHYQRFLQEIQEEKGGETYHFMEWLESLLALTDQWFFLPDEASHVKAVEQILNAYQHTDAEQNAEIAKFLRELSQKRASIQISTSAQQVAAYLLQYIEADARSQDRMLAAAALIEKVAHFPSFPSALLAQIYSDRGWAYLHLKEYEQAMSDFHRALDLKPDYAWVYGSRGLVYRTLRDYERAIADFDRAIELNPDYAWAFGSRGLTFRFLNDDERAIADFDRAIELNPKYTWAYGSRGQTYRLRKDYERAIADFDRAIEIDAEYVWAYEQRGRAYNNLKMYRRAIEDFDRAIELDPHYFWAYLHRGITYRMLKDYERAMADLDRALELEPQNASIFAQKGFVSLWMRNTRQAITDYIRGWEIDPNYLHNGWMVEWSRMCQGAPDREEIERLEAIAAVNPQHYTAYVCRGVALWIRGRFGESVAEFEQAIPLDPGAGSAYFWKAMALALLEQDELAITLIRKFLELELPPVLLSPLQWLEESRPDLYQNFVKPLLTQQCNPNGV